jgi:hypothetical protein
MPPFLKNDNFWEFPHFPGRGAHTLHPDKNTPFIYCKLLRNGMAMIGLRFRGKASAWSLRMKEKK